MESPLNTTNALISAGLAPVGITTDSYVKSSNSSSFALRTGLPRRKQRLFRYPQAFLAGYLIVPSFSDRSLPFFACQPAQPSLRAGTARLITRER